MPHLILCSHISDQIFIPTLFTHMNWACRGILFFGPAPGDLERGQKVKYHLISFTKSISKIFYTKLCVCSHKWKMQNISDRTFILSPGSCLGALGVPRGSKKYFKHGHVNYEIDGDDEQNRNTRKSFHPKAKLVTLGLGQISNITKFRYLVNFKDFYTKLCCVLTNKI